MASRASATVIENIVKNTLKLFINGLVGGKVCRINELKTFEFVLVVRKLKFIRIIIIPCFVFALKFSTYNGSCIRDSSGYPFFIREFENLIYRDEKR